MLHVLDDRLLERTWFLLLHTPQGSRPRLLALLMHDPTVEIIMKMNMFILKVPHILSPKV
jgi:hypothetical protein